MSAVQQFVDVMCGPAPPDEPPEIARCLAECVIEACKRLNLDDAEIYCWGPIVTMILTGSSAWEAVVVGPEAYQLYPGFFRDGGDRLEGGGGNDQLAELLHAAFFELLRLLGERLEFGIAFIHPCLHLRRVHFAHAPMVTTVVHGGAHHGTPFRPSGRLREGGKAGAGQHRGDENGFEY